MDYLTGAAHALAYVLVASRRHTDLFEWAQRDVPLPGAGDVLVVTGGAWTTRKLVFASR